MNENEMCPLCTARRCTLLYDGHISLYRCKSCNAVFNASHRALEYDDSYFNEEYRKQYGKSYLEDFHAIYALAKKRLARISSLTRHTSGLLDIGSAYGFFLKAAIDEGFEDLSGIEICKEAARHCEHTFGIQVEETNFETYEFSRKFNIITAWYFIEHLHDPVNAFSKIFNALNNEGVFAFSVPSFFGPQFIFHRNEWFQSHPLDHRVNFSPHLIRRFLRTIGFSKIITYPGGIHPQRVFSPLIAQSSLIRSLYTRASLMVSFSDTLEVYAQKKKISGF